MISYDELGSSRRVAIMVALIATQYVQMIPIGAGLSTSLAIADKVTGEQSEATWIAASYPMTQGAFVLIGGRLGDVYGYRYALLGGAAFWTLWILVAAFAHNIVTIAMFRGLAGAGGGFIVPNAVAILSHTFPPGRLRNLSMALFGAMAPIGAGSGCIISSLFVQLSEWKWFFIFLALLGAIVFSTVAFLVPHTEAADKGGKVDWMGSYLGVGGLILFNFVWNQAPAVGWQDPYIYVLLVVAVLHFAVFVFWEAKIAHSPILPFDIWKAPSFLPLTIVVFLSFMSFGIFAWYYFMWNLTIRNMTMLSASAGIMPLCVGGAIAAYCAAWLIPRLNASYILAIGALAMTITSVITASMPAQQIYWRTMFPAACFVAFCPDFIFTAAQIITSNSVQRKQQGIAGSLIGTLLTYGISTGIGFGGTVEVYTNDGGRNRVQGYKNALFLGTGFAAASCVLSLMFVRIKKDKREGWDDADVVYATAEKNVNGDKHTSAAITDIA